MAGSWPLDHATTTTGHSAASICPYRSNLWRAPPGRSPAAALRLRSCSLVPTAPAISVIFFITRVPTNRASPPRAGLPAFRRKRRPHCLGFRIVIRALDRRLRLDHRCCRSAWTDTSAAARTERWQLGSQSRLIKKRGHLEKIETAGNRRHFGVNSTESNQEQNGVMVGKSGAPAER
jgi:hypothetical protein